MRSITKFFVLRHFESNEYLVWNKDVKRHTDDPEIDFSPSIKKATRFDRRSLSIVLAKFSDYLALSRETSGEYTSVHQSDFEIVHCLNVKENRNKL